jgi:hypothetical protein
MNFFQNWPIEVKLELGFIIFGNGDVFSIDEPNQYIE